MNEIKTDIASAAVDIWWCWYE